MNAKLKSLKSIQRKSVRLTQASLIKTRPLLEDRPIPLLIEPAVDHLNLIDWAEQHRTRIDELLLTHGALLFRGFQMPDIESFQAFARAVSPELLDYLERAAPRRELAQKVFTSTEYPADQWIPLHHEMSYSHNWPTRLYFYCEVAPSDRGYTPITWEKEIFELIPEAIKQPFFDKGVMYVRNYGQGADMPWWEVFQTRDRDQVEAYLRSTNTEFEWIGESILRTRMRRQVTATHPITGDTVWFNHAHMFHISNMPEAVREALLQEFAQDELPRNAFYGDGSPIPDEVAIEIRRIYQDNAVCFPWQRGDVMLLDNFLTAHGRSPFQGPRKIAVAMSDLYTHPDYR